MYHEQTVYIWNFLTRTILVGLILDDSTYTYDIENSNWKEIDHAENALHTADNSWTTQNQDMETQFM